MKEPIGAGFAGIVALAAGAAFGLGSRSAGRFVEDLEALTVELCRDTGSAYGLVIEYGGNRARNEGFGSDGATRRALQMVGNEADVGITILGFAGTG